MTTITYNEIAKIPEGIKYEGIFKSSIKFLINDSRGTKLGINNKSSPIEKIINTLKSYDNTLTNQLIGMKRLKTYVKSVMCDDFFISSKDYQKFVIEQIRFYKEDNKYFNNLNISKKGLTHLIKKIGEKHYFFKKEIETEIDTYYEGEIILQSLYNKTQNQTLKKTISKNRQELFRKLIKKKQEENILISGKEFSTYIINSMRNKLEKTKKNNLENKICELVV